MPGKALRKWFILMTSGYLVLWTKLINEYDPSNSVGKPTRKIDSLDHELGLLDDGMKRYWLFLDGLGERIDDFVNKVGELCDCISVDKEKISNPLPDAKIDEYIQKFSALAADVHRSVFAYSVNRVVFDEMLQESFTGIEGKPVLGIREGYEVVCRPYDNRGDGRSKVDDYRDVVTRFRNACGLSILSQLAVPIAVMLSRMEEGEGIEIKPNPPAEPKQ